MMKKVLFLFMAATMTNMQGTMAQEKITQTAGHVQLGDFAPKFAELNDNVLFGEVWNHPGLSPRDRSMVTVATLIGKGMPSMPDGPTHGGFQAGQGRVG